MALLACTVESVLSPFDSEHISDHDYYLGLYQLAPFLLSAIPVQATTAALLPGAASTFASVTPVAGRLTYSGTITGLENGQSYAGKDVRTTDACLTPPSPGRHGKVCCYLPEP